ncbi:DoxX family protein [Horticoccus luteus]|uniref:DoxX family protein n=1 Tax=Horticoccus luteus TaxID=2862869 RepID=A0A8F9TYQ0_9BACT|nr:DoxX family protein [Horticoccus luteus]QYM80585.1 DoxX family protein [Horticoccus luteus]
MRQPNVFRTCGEWLQSPLLLALRLYWGIGFVFTGWGKLHHLDRTAAYFGSLGVPWPMLNAAAAGATELLCGALLALGLFARPAALPLIGVMSVAYATAERASVTRLWNDPDACTSATPFLFLLTALIVLAFGPGFFSLDTWFARPSASTAAKSS